MEGRTWRLVLLWGKERSAVIAELMSGGLISYQGDQPRSTPLIAPSKSCQVEMFNLKVRTITSCSWGKYVGSLSVLWVGCRWSRDWPSRGCTDSETTTPSWGGLTIQYGKLKVKVAQSCPALCDPMDCTLPGSVHGFSQGKNTGLSSCSLLHGIFPAQGSNLGCLPYCRQILYHCATREAQEYWSG